MTGFGKDFLNVAMAKAWVPDMKGKWPRAAC